MKRPLTLLSALLLGSTLANADPAVRVVDGDSLVIDNQRIRLWGIDAPERDQTCEGRDGRTYECGRDATAVMVELTRGQRVTCETRDTDRYGRTVAVCRTPAGELNAAMVRRGWAVVYRRYAKGAYESEEAAARAEHLGIWAGRFTLPEQYRHGNRSNPR